MADESVAADQPTTTATEAGGATESSDPYVPSFLRDEPEPESEETPETQTEEGEGEPTEETEPGEQADETEQGEPTTESTQDDFLASLTSEEHAYYAKRYPTLYKAYQDPNQPADLRQAFIDRVNQDHAYAELREQKETEDQGEPTPQPTPTPDAAEQTKQYYAQIDDIVAHQINPAAVEEMGKGVLEALGVDVKSTDPEIVNIVKNSGKLGKVLARGAVDLVATTLPGMLSSRLEMVMPGITEMYYDNLRAREWEKQRSQTVKLPDGTTTKPYAKLPAMGSPAWDTAVDKVLREMPELREMFDNLPPHQRFAKQYAIAAKLMTGQQVSPAMVAQAVDTGRKLADKTKIARNAGRALGGGKPTGEVRPGGTGNEDIFGPGVEEYKRRGG